MLDSLNKERALKKASKGKGKAVVNNSKSSTSASTSVFSDIPMRPLPLPTSESSNNSGGIRAGFAPINKGFAPISGIKQMDKLTPVSVIKRKPTGEASGAPVSKKV